MEPVCLMGSACGIYAWDACASCHELLVKVGDCDPVSLRDYFLSHGIDPDSRPLHPDTEDWLDTLGDLLFQCTILIKLHEYARPWHVEQTEHGDIMAFHPDHEHEEI